MIHIAAKLRNGTACEKGGVSRRRVVDGNILWEKSQKSAFILGCPFDV